jgi:hypothetical protein
VKPRKLSCQKIPIALKTGFCGLGLGVGAAVGAPSDFGGSAIMDCGVQHPGSRSAVETLVSWNVTCMRTTRILEHALFDSANDLQGNFFGARFSSLAFPGVVSPSRRRRNSWKGYKSTAMGPRAPPCVHICYPDALMQGLVETLHGVHFLLSNRSAVGQSINVSVV